MKLVEIFNSRIVLSSLLMIMGVVTFAQPACPTCGGPGDGLGGTGTGEPASPIDSYVYIMMVVGLILIAYFSKKYKKVIQ